MYASAQLKAKAPKRIVLLGDTIFDNVAYTTGKPDVAQHLRAIDKPCGIKLSEPERSASPSRFLGQVLVDLVERKLAANGREPDAAARVGRNHPRAARLPRMDDDLILRLRHEDNRSNSFDELVAGKLGASIISLSRRAQNFDENTGIEDRLTRLVGGIDLERAAHYGNICIGRSIRGQRPHS